MTTAIIPAFSSTDLAAEALLPADWAEQIHAAVIDAATPALLRGGTSTSLEPAGSDIAYRLLDGNAVREQLPWLDALYRGELAAIASAAAGRPLVPALSVQAGVNVNVLDGPGGRYELHLDSNPLTGLLFVTAHDADGGGQLLFQA